MHHWYVFATSLSLLLLAACGTAEWVNTNNPTANYTLDYNTCEMDMTKDPKLQQGNRYFIQQATERCMLKKGWMLKEPQ